MPRYFFDIHDGRDVSDQQGRELVGRDAIRAEALARAAAYAADPGNLERDGVIVVTVREGPDAVVMRVRLVCQIEEVGA